MSKPGETAKADTKTDTKTPAKPEKKVGPTPEQLAAIHGGGSYKFDPATGKHEQTRKPSKKDPELAAKQRAAVQEKVMAEKKEAK